ncbi:Rmd1p [Sugiyamaella lignohabitans]|uniref:Rmd1p n=1 Tax=Sugiyamaella lignohabitans TaxID=796027 RepID=A0A161HGQ6_9ASCO|nr:Rmd1p [Sugiyamaella lignohabitans]ANB11047.1 Rmd1p [Sugiyamaella lignohabitans]
MSEQTPLLAPQTSAGSAMSRNQMPLGVAQGTTELMSQDIANQHHLQQKGQSQEHQGSSGSTVTRTGPSSTNNQFHRHNNPNINTTPIRPDYPPVINGTGAGVRRNGPQRTSYTTQKLKLLPDEPVSTDDDDISISEGDVYSQVARIKDRPARKDAERLGKAHRSMLPRVTAYCTAGSYRINDLSRYFLGRKSHGTAPKLFDECLYTPYRYRRDNGSSSTNTSPTLSTAPDPTSDETIVSSEADSQPSDFIRLDDEGGEIDVSYGRSELFLFDYGVTVFWGFTEAEEKRFLKELARFETEKLADEDVQIEEFNYYITKSYQPRIYNDFITLRDNTNYMIKLSISHAIAQSVKISLFEELVDNTIEDTQDFPQEIALTGKINMNRKNIMKSIGELFILRISKLKTVNEATKAIKYTNNQQILICTDQFWTRLNLCGQSHILSPFIKLPVDILKSTREFRS